MRPTTKVRRKGNRAQAQQEKRYVSRNPMPEFFGIERPLTNRAAGMIISIGGALVREMVEQGRLPEGVNLDTNLHVDVFKRTKFPPNVAGALAIGRQIGLMERDKDVGLEGLADRSRVQAHLGKIVSANHNKALDIQVVAPKIVEQTFRVYEELEPLGINPPRGLQPDTALRMRFATSEHKMTDQEVAGFAHAFQDVMHRRTGSQNPVVYFGATEVYPDLSKYNR